MANNGEDFGPFRVVTKQEQIREPSNRLGKSKPVGTITCLECRKDTPPDKMVYDGGYFSSRGQLCKDCFNRREERLRNHARRIRSNLRQKGEM